MRTFWQRLVNPFAANNSSRFATTPAEIAAILRGDTSSSDHLAMSIATFHACVNLLSRSQAMLPLELFKLSGDGQSRLKAPRDPYGLVLSKPNRWQTPYHFEQFMAASKHVHGNAYAYISRGGDGRVLEMVPLAANRMTVVQNADLSLTYKYRTQDGEERVYQQQEMHHRRGLSLDGITGLSTLQAAARTVNLAVLAEQHGEATFANQAKPSGVITSPKPLTAEAVERLRNSFEAAHSGAKNAGRTIVLEDGLQWEAVGMTAEDLEYIAGRKLQKADIATFFGVPPHMVGDIERGTSWGSGIEQQSLGYLVYTLNAYLIADQQELIRDLFIDDTLRLEYAVRHETAGLTRAEFAGRQQGLETMHRSGVISANEWRAIEGYNPRPGGNNYASAGTVPATRD